MRMLEICTVVGNVVKVGPKGKHLTIPDNWDIARGKVKSGDMFLNLFNLNCPKWSVVELDDVGENVEDFELVIRGKSPLDK